MAFMDKLGKVASKALDVAGDTVDLGKAKGKVVLEKNKIKEVKEAIGEYVYISLKNGEELDLERLKAYCTEIDGHQEEIDKLQAEADVSGQKISNSFDDAVNDIKGAMGKAKQVREECDAEVCEAEACEAEVSPVQEEAEE